PGGDVGPGRGARQRQGRRPDRRGTAAAWRSYCRGAARSRFLRLVLAAAAARRYAVTGRAAAMEFRTLAEGLQFPEGPVALADGSVLLVEIAAGTLTRVAPDGTKSIAAHTGGGPNGAALGPD